MKTAIVIILFVTTAIFLVGAVMVIMNSDTSKEDNSSNNQIIVTQPYKEDFTLSSLNCSDGVTVDIEKTGANSFTATILYGSGSMEVYVNVHRSITGDKVDPGYYLVFRVTGHDGLFVKDMKDTFYEKKMISWSTTDNAEYSGKTYVTGFYLEFHTGNYQIKTAGFSFTSTPIT